jgi:hypothetical protein
MKIPLPKPEQKYSYADYLTCDEQERWEIIAKKIILPHIKSLKGNVRECK